MNKQREALQVALQALEEIGAHYPADWEFDICVEAAKLVRETLAEPEHHYEDDLGMVARKPLNDTELWTMWVESPSDVLRFARTIERAHGIIE